MERIVDFREYLGEIYPYVKESIVRCRYCKWYVKDETMWDTDEWCIRCKDDDTGVFEVDPDGFCAWGEPAQ